MSGHSRWANIKHKKGRADAKKGKIFTRIAKEISIAARQGGGDADANPRLRLAIQNARAVNMPSDNIKRAIQKGTGEIEGASFEEIIYEGYAPFGVAIILETVTDNKNRTVSELRSQFGKLGGNLGEANSVAWNFERKGVIKIDTDKFSEDDLMELVLESGADDLEFDTETTRIITSLEAFPSVNKFFNDKKIKIIESKLEYIPKNLISINNPADAKKVLKFIDAFEEHDDVQNVYSNFEISDDIMEKLADES